MSVLKPPDPRKEAFTKSWWEEALHQGPSDVYWDPSKGTWSEYPTASHTISDVGISPPNLRNVTPADEVFAQLEQSWATIKTQHPNAIFDPRLRVWRVQAKRPGPGPQPPKNGDLEERTRLAKAELDELDRQRRLNILNPEEWERRRKEVRRKYGLE